MGRCGRDRTKYSSIPIDHFILNVSINDCVYLHERLLIEFKEKDKTHLSRIISYDMQRNNQLEYLIFVLKFMF